MATLNSVLQMRREDLLYSSHLFDYIHLLISPWRVRRAVIFTEVNYEYLTTDIILEAANIPGSFRTSLDSADILGGGADYLAQVVAVRFAEWFLSIYVPPEDNIELGEN